MASLFAASEKRRSGADGPHARKVTRPHRKRTQWSLRMQTPKADEAGGPSPPAHPCRVGGDGRIGRGRAWRPKGGRGTADGARPRWRGRARRRPPAPRHRRGQGPSGVRSRQGGLFWTGMSGGGLFLCGAWITSLYRPVWPKPPAPLSVSDRASVSTGSAEATGATTIWAIRAPRSTAKGSLPRLHRITQTSPR